MPATGSKFHFDARPPTSEQLAAAWRPVIDATIDAFGPERTMIGSNFPVDRQTANYSVLWNAYKRATAHYRPAERQALFAGTASRIYRIEMGTASGAPASAVVRQS